MASVVGQAGTRSLLGCRSFSEMGGSRCYASTSPPVTPVAHVILSILEGIWRACWLCLAPGGSFLSPALSVTFLHPPPPPRGLLRAAKEGMLGAQAGGGSLVKSKGGGRQQGGRGVPVSSSAVPSTPQTLDECVAQVEAELAILGEAIPDISLFR